METMDEPYRPVVTTQAELEAVWRHLMRPLGFRGRSIWMMRIAADRRAVPQLLEIVECDEPPGPDERAGLVEVLAQLDTDDPGGSFAFLRSRPGRGIEDTDRAWAAALTEAGRDAGVRLEVVHLATDDDITAVPLDEIGLRRPA